MSLDRKMSIWKNLLIGVISKNTPKPCPSLGVARLCAKFIGSEAAMESILANNVHSKEKKIQKDFRNKGINNLCALFVIIIITFTFNNPLGHTNVCPVNYNIKILKFTEVILT